MSNTQDNIVDIHGLDKATLLLEMWLNQAPAAFFAMNNQCAPGFDKASARNVAAKGYIDYFCGRCIKTDISGDAADPEMYDRDSGKGTLRKIVQRMRCNM